MGSKNQRDPFPETASATITHNTEYSMLGYGSYRSSSLVLFVHRALTCKKFHMGTRNWSRDLSPPPPPSHILSPAIQRRFTVIDESAHACHRPSPLLKFSAFVRKSGSVSETTPHWSHNFPLIKESLSWSSDILSPTVQRRLSVVYVVYACHPPCPLL